MASIIFNTLTFSKKLKLAGFTDQQAEGQVEAIAELFEEKIATKEDIKKLEQDIRVLRKDIQKDFLIFRKELLVSLGSMIAAAVVLLPAIFKLFNFL